MAYNNSRNYPRNNSRDNRPTPPATAPYNFVPLPIAPVPSPLSLFLTEKDSKTGKVKLNFEKYADYIAENGKYDGIIDFEITALTPLFIGDGTGKFFAPDGKPVIPGSTIRGMVKNYLKILSCGTMRSENNEDLTSRHLYFRDMASKTSLKKYYVKKLNIQRGHDSYGICSINDAKHGFLARKQDGTYVIYPAKGEKKDERYDNPEEMIKKSPKIEILGDTVFLHSGPMPTSMEAIDKQLERGKLTYKKRYYVFHSPNWQKEIIVPKSIIENYNNDKERGGLNLLEDKKANINNSYAPAKGKGFSWLTPCFYIEKNNRVEHFGAAKFYRIPYDRAIEDSIPSSLKNENIIDFVEAIFGRKEDFASRIFFEDASIIDDPSLVPEPEAYTMPLMGPKPTSFQFYLEQKKQTDQSNLKHWDSGDTKIRGYKLYWHKKIGSGGWVLKGKQVEKTLSIKPEPKGSKFKGRIRFKNLSKEELGAILAVLNLGVSENGNNGRFKIGMGKPIGMGSIDFAYTLKLIDRKTRYSSLFSGESWKSGFCDKSAKDFIDAFQKYINEKGDIESYKKIKATLDIMMNCANVPNPQDIAYMTVGDDRFKDRIPLPYPEDVIKK